MELIVHPVPPQKCEPPKEMIAADRLGRRCEDHEGPEYTHAGKTFNHYCVFREDHAGTLHYAFVIDGDGVKQWYCWGTRYA